MKTKAVRQTVAVLASPAGIVTLYAVLGLVGVLNHAMWRDEFNTWLILRDSDSLGEMLGRVTYQGHTALWALSLSFLRLFVDAPVMMQLFHWALAVGAIALFWRYSPFTRLQKILFTFGYIPFYQYLLIARPYVLGVISLFGACALFSTRKRTYLPLAIMLALMANSHAYALFISVALLATLGLEFCLDADQRQQYLRQAKTYDWLLSLLIVAASYAFAIYILAPPPDSYNHGGLDAWSFAFDPQHLLRAWGRLFGGYTLIVPSSRWPDLIVCGLITLFAVAVFVLRLVRKPFALCFYSLANLIILAFTYFRFLGGGPRHFGQFLLVLVAALWIAANYPESDGLARRLSLPSNLLNTARQWHKPVLMTILTVQFLAGVLYAYPRDLLIPFSAARETAHYIRQQGWQDAFIVASRDATMASISGYLGRPLYYPELRRLGSFTLYREERVPVDQPQILAQTQALLETQPDLSRILLVLNEPLTLDSPALTLEPIRSFERSWVDTERYHLYWASLAR